MLRWLLAYLFALASALNPALAALTVNQLSGFNAFTTPAEGGGGDASVVLTDCYHSTTDATNYTFSSADVSTADASRIILVGVSAEDTADTFGLLSGTIGGNAATRAHTSTTNFSIHANFMILGLASGTTADIGLSFSESVTSATICVWALYNFSSASFTAVTYDTDTASASMDISVAGGEIGDLFAAMCAAHGIGTTLTYTGTTTNQYESHVEGTVRAGYTFPLSSSGTHSATCDPDGSADSVAVGVLVRP